MTSPAGTTLADYLTLPDAGYTVSGDNVWLGSFSFVDGEDEAVEMVTRNFDGITASALASITVEVVEGDDHDVGGTAIVSPAITDYRPAFSIATTGELTDDPLTFTVSRAGSSTAGATVNVGVVATAGHVADSTPMVVFTDGDTTAKTIELARVTSVTDTTSGTVAATIEPSSDSSYNIVASANRAVWGFRAPGEMLSTVSITGGSYSAATGVSFTVSRDAADAVRLDVIVSFTSAVAEYGSLSNQVIMIAANDTDSLPFFAVPSDSYHEAGDVTATIVASPVEYNLAPETPPNPSDPASVATVAVPVVHPTVFITGGTYAAATGVSFTVSRDISNTASLDVIVSFTSAVTEYGSLSNQTITIPANETDSPTFFAVPADSFHEAGDVTATIVASPDDYDRAPETPPSPGDPVRVATVAVPDSRPVFALDMANSIVNSEDWDTVIRITRTDTSPMIALPAGGASIELNFTDVSGWMDGNASGGSRMETVTFPAGQTEYDAIITEHPGNLPSIDTLTATLSSSDSNYATSASSITVNVPPVFALPQGNMSYNASPTNTISYTLWKGPANVNVTANITVTAPDGLITGATPNANAMYSSGILTITHPDTTGQLNGTLTLDPSHQEGVVTLALRPENGVYRLENRGDAATNSGTVVIGTPPVASIAVDNSTITENGTGNCVTPVTPPDTPNCTTVTVSLNESAPAGGLPVMVALTAGGAAGATTLTDDYTVSGATVDPSPFTVTVPATMDEISFTIMAVNDTDVEGDGTLSFALQTGTAYTVNTTPAMASVEVTISSEDVPEISISDGMVDGTTVTFPIESTEMPLTDLTVNVTITGPEALVTGGTTTFTATIANTGTEGTVSYTLPSAIHPGGTLTATLMDDTVNPATYEVSTTEGSAEAVATSTEPTFGITNVVLKGDSSGAVVVTVSRTDSHGTANMFSNLMVTVRATSGNNYIAGDTANLVAIFADQSITSAMVEFPRATDVADTVEAEVVDGTGYGLMQQPDNPPTVVTSLVIEVGAGITSTGGASVAVTEESDATYTLVLTTQPTHDVVITLTSSDTAAATVTSTLTFTSVNWNTAQDVTVTGEEDNDTVDATVTISYMVTSTDPAYSGFSLATQSVAVTDNDLAGAGVTSTGGASVAVTEGSTSNYTLVLDIEPTGTVTIALTSDDTSAVTVTPTLSFDATDWSTAKMVTVTAVDDADMTGETVSISYAISGGGYDLATLAAQSVAVTDDDAAGISSDGGVSVAVTEESDATYTLVLTTQPTHDVVITLTSSNTAAATVTSTLTFTSVNWNTAQDVTVTGEEDNDTVDATVTISYMVTSTDPAYSGFSLAVQSVAVTDNDLAGAGVTSTGGASVAVTEGSTSTYTLVLAVEPTGTVTIALTSSDTGAVTVTPTLSFDASDWNTAKMVTVTAVDDADMTGETVSISYAISGGGYDLATLAAQSVAVTDNDVVGAGITSTGGASVAVTEGSDATYTLVLTTQPTHDVVITLTSSDTAAATVTSTLTFTSVNWNTAQDVTVTGEEDNDTVDATVTISYMVTSTDPAYSGFSLAVQSVAVTDNDLAGAGVTSTGGVSVAVTEGSTSNYTLVLDIEPTGTVTIALTSDDTSAVTVTPTLSFDASDWNTAKMVTVTAVDDADMTGETVSISYAISGGGYDLATLAAQSVAVTDNDVVGAGITSTGGASVAVTEESDATYTLVLTTQPTHDVVITLTSSNTDAATVTSTLTFTSVNWNTAQDVTVTGEEDNDTVDATVTISYMVTSTDPAYSGFSLAVQSVAVTDNDLAGAAVTSTGVASLSVTEGSSATYTLVLDIEPTGTVTIALTSDDTTSVTVTPTLSFDASDWNTAKMVTVTAVDDADMTGETVSISYAISGGGYDLATLAAQSVAVTDDDAAGISSDGGVSVAVTEGSDATYTLVLTTQPTHDVVITLTSSNTDAATVTSTLTFTSVNWNTAQDVTVTGEEDNDTVDATVTISYMVTSTDPAYSGFSLAVQSVAVTDNDLAGAGVTSTGGASVAVTEGSTSNYTLVLDIEPTGTVTIALTSDDTSAVTVTPTLSFDASDWNTAKMVTVTAVDDADMTGETVSISYAISGGGYDLATLAAQSVAVTDDDAAGISSDGGVSVAVTEGSDATYTLVLTTQPTHDVVITLTSSNTAAATVTSTLTFTSVNWNTAQDVTVTGEEDNDTVDATVTISYMVTSTDPAYSGFSLAVQSVAVTDNDLAGAGVTSTGGASVAVTEGSTSNYTLVLDIEPTGTVTIALTSDDTSAVTVTPTLSFDASDWNTAKMVTVTGVDDVDMTGETVSISYAISGGGYDLATLAAQSVAVTDNDVVGAGITSTGGASVAVTEESDATYTLVLTTQPTHDVVITLTSSDTAAATVTSTLTFTSVNWNTAQDVTVTGEEDNDTVDATVTISYMVTSTDPAYSGFSLAVQSVAVTDNDLAGAGVTSTGGVSVAVTEGSTSTYTLVLDIEPTGTVTIALTSDDTSAVTVTPTLSFDATDWNTAKMVTVTAVDDADMTGETVSISYAISGGGYDLATLAAQSVAVTDNDVVGAGITSTGGASVAVTEESDATYTLVLTTQPTHDVVITLTSSNTAAATVTSTLTFTSVNWNTAQDVTVTGEEDNDTVDATVTISYMVTSTDPAYSGFSLAVQSVAVTDNDLAGAGVTSTGGASVAVTEGSTSTYTLVLAVEPTGTVTIALTSDDTSAVTVTPTLSFDASDWNTAKMVTVTAVDDADMTGETVSISYAISGGGYDLATLAAQSVAVTDDDAAGISSDGGVSVAVTEGSDATYTLVLTTQPTHDVVITLTSSNTAAATVTSTLTFTSVNWNTAQDVTVTGEEDNDTVDATVTISYMVTSTDPAYSGFSLATQSVAVTDNDLAGAGVTSTGGASVAVTEGGTSTYTLVLAIEPTGTVTIALTSDDTSAVTVTPTLSFDATDWNTAKMVTVTGVDDADMTGETVSISYAISGGGYDLATLAAQSVAVTDDDAAGISSDGGVSVAVTEESDATYTLVLTTQPTHDVVITLTSSNTAAATVTSTLTFTSVNWNTAQDVTVTGEEDNDTVDATVTISYMVTSTDPAYSGFSLAVQSVAVTDNDLAGAGVTSTGGASVAVTEGSTSNYTLVLDIEPTGTVTIALTSDDTSAVTVTPTLSFDASDWNTAKMVTVTG